MKKFYLVIVLSWLCTLAFGQNMKLAAVGSSTTAGVGASVLDSCWVRRFSHYYKNELGVLDTAYMLAIGGYNVYKGMPSSYIPPPGREGPDPNNNVTRAVDLLRGLAIPANGVVIVNFPTNGFETFSIAEIMACFQLIYDSAVHLNNKCYITTTQPRTSSGFNTPEVKKKLADIKDSIINRFGVTNTINFWDGMFNPADTSILAAYSAGDGIHFNDAGHRILFQRVVAKNVFGVVLPITVQGFDGAIKNKQIALQWAAQHDNSGGHFTIQRSSNGLQFETLQQIPVRGGAGDQRYEYTDVRPLPGNNFYRLQVTEPGQSYFSKVICVKNDGQTIVLKKLYPVPATQTITLEIAASQKQPITIDILNSAGVRVQQYARRLEHEDNTITLPVGQLPRGSYFIRVTFKGSEPVTQSFTK